jgi:outer membrane protein assembly factor BamB
MKKSGIITSLILSGIVFLIAGFSAGTPDNGWRGPNRDGKVEGFKTPATWPATFKKVWEVKVGLGDASPVLSGNGLFLHTKIDSSEVVMCLNAQTGEKVWQIINNRAPIITGGPASHPGPRSTPYVTGNKIITIGAAGYVTCLNTSNGELFWKSESYSEVPQFYVACSPLVVGNKVIAHLNGKEKGTIVAFDLNSGKEIWKLSGESSTYSSPILMGNFKNMVVVQGEKDLLGISGDKGTLLWKTPALPETRFYNSSTPVISGEQVIIGGQGSGIRDLKVTKNGDAFEVNEKWKNPDMSLAFNTPVLKDGFLYGNESRLGYIFCLNAETGAKCWVDTIKNNRFAAVLDLGKVLISLPATGQLIVFKPNNQKYEEIARFKVADTEVYAHPVVIGNKVIVKSKELLTCWAIE